MAGIDEHSKKGLKDEFDALDNKAIREGKEYQDKLDSGDVATWKELLAEKESYIGGLIAQLSESESKLINAEKSIEPIKRENSILKSDYELSNKFAEKYELIIKKLLAQYVNGKEIENRIEAALKQLHKNDEFPDCIWYSDHKSDIF